MYPYHITHGYIRLRSLKKPMKYFTYLSPSVITVFDQTSFGIITKNKMLSESPGSLSAISANFKRVPVLYYHFLQSTFTLARSKPYKKATFYIMHEIPHGTAGNVYNMRAQKI